jgi:acetyl esterase
MAAAARLTPRERLESRLGRGLAVLPGDLQVRLSGKPPTVVDGLRLAPGIQLSLAVLERRNLPKPETLTPTQAREERTRLAAVYAGAPAQVGAVRDLEIDAETPLKARHYVPAESGDSQPLLVYYHGGGFVYGNLDTHDGVCRLLCRHTGAHVLAVDYRLAPEHPFPVAVDDALAAFRWAVAHAGELGADDKCVGVGGDSAGGNLAAVVARLSARDGGPAPALQLLIYPVTDFSRRRRSHELFGEGFLLTRSEMDWFEANYLGSVGAEQSRDPRASPLLADDLSGLAPALVVTAGFDPLRDEGEAYAQALADAGTPATLRRFASFIHAFVNLAGTNRECRDSVIEIAGMARAMFAHTQAGGAGVRKPSRARSPFARKRSGLSESAEADPPALTSPA